MKKYAWVVILFLAASVVRGEEQTLFGSVKLEHGGYGAVSVKFTNIEGRFGVLVGGQASWIINHTFTLGAGGWGLARESKLDRMYDSDRGERLRYALGYGGVIFGITGGSDKLIHPSFELLIGGGALSYYYRNHDYPYYRDYGDGHSSHVSDDPFFVLEPTVSLELNVASFMRVAMGGGYRMVSGVRSYTLTNSDVSGASGSLVFKFGKF